MGRVSSEFGFFVRPKYSLTPNLSSSTSNYFQIKWDTDLSDSVPLFDQIGEGNGQLINTGR